MRYGDPDKKDEEGDNFISIYTYLYVINMHTWKNKCRNGDESICVYVYVTHVRGLSGRFPAM